MLTFNSVYVFVNSIIHFIFLRTFFKHKNPFFFANTFENKLTFMGYLIEYHYFGKNFSFHCFFWPAGGDFLPAGPAVLSALAQISIFSLFLVVWASLYNVNFIYIYIHDVCNYIIVFRGNT